MSSCGGVDFDIDSGVVTDCRLTLDGYPVGTRPAVVDVDEWRRRYPGEWGMLDRQHDILDFGYWTDAGLYEPPCEDWRRDRENMLREDGR